MLTSPSRGDDVAPTPSAPTDPGLARAQVRASVQTAVRRRRVVLTLGSVAAVAAVAGLDAPILWWVTAGAVALLAGYLALVARIRHLAVEREMGLAFGAPGGDFDWQGLHAQAVAPDRSGVAAEADPARPLALARFVAAYLVGWALTPVVALVRVAGGDLSDLRRHGILDRLVSLQRYGRQQSLRVLAVSVATAAGVTAVGGVAGTAMANAAPAAASSPQPGSGYTVQPGDTLGSIAARHATTVAALAAANHLANPNLVFVGQVLTVPSGTTTAAPATTGPTYTVRSGDTVSAIAARYGTTVAAVASANHLANPDQISVGQVLTVTGGRAPAATTPAATMPAATPAATGSGSTYTVQAGDTLAAIAARYGTTAVALAAANHLPDPNLILAGQVLAVGGQDAPAPAATPAAAPAPAAPAAAAPAAAAPAPAATLTTAPATSSSAAATAVRVALAQVGKPYRWAGAGPSSFDCSGLVMYAWAAAGVSLPHYTVTQYDDTSHIAESQLQPGDLVFYGGSAPGHVAMYVGNGQVVSANTTGTFVQTQSITYDGTPTGFTRVR